MGFNLRYGDTPPPVRTAQGIFGQERIPPENDSYCQTEALLPFGEEEQANIGALPHWGKAEQ